ncbi:scyllo-inosamine-4-phosphate amidinotransferase [Micromonospora sp. HM134]|uniref:scyllo-inosamine-4-phosphate amidinotransferase n=1 Tax=unclassified Micromonospora TaxID=2617518 RepID=UPI001198BBD2|nr:MULTISPECIES: scyllo-inosamine-4-phosphate amidinotransferase [unclassified Micromonospora]QDY09332.1 scyllo-inosamine-4-phosphate amidinotransferase [Micromonospora sp. HM134]
MTAERTVTTPAPSLPTAFGAPAVNSWDEFTALREIIVGNATHARLPQQDDPSAWLSCFPQLTRAELGRIAVGEMPAQVIEETNEDLAVLCTSLRGLGVTVHRPDVIDHRVEFASPHWRSAGFTSYCPRDLTLVVGSTIIETASPMRSRYFELFGLRPLFQDYLRRGATWLAAPRPRLTDELYLVDPDGLPDLGDSEPVFDAANVLRLGRDLFYQVSRSGNELGLRWLESVVRLLGDIRVHPLRGIYGYTHIDSTIALLRPGLVLLNPGRITPDGIPDPLRGWDVLWCPPLRRPAAGPPTLSEHWISMNLLMVDEEHAIVDADQPELIAALERRGITVLPHRLRHAQLLGGGFHCVTLDTIRAGGPENYLD